MSLRTMNLPTLHHLDLDDCAELGRRSRSTGSASTLTRSTSMSRMVCKVGRFMVRSDIPCAGRLRREGGLGFASTRHFDCAADPLPVYPDKLPPGTAYGLSECLEAARETVTKCPDRVLAKKGHIMATWHRESIVPITPTSMGRTAGTLRFAMMAIGLPSRRPSPPHA